MFAIAFILVACAILHAGWNVYVKYQVNERHLDVDPLRALKIIVVTQASIGVLGWVLFGLPRLASIYYLVPSIALQAVSISLLGTGYRIADFTKVYPMSRGATTASALLLTAAFFGRWPNLPSTAGLLAIVGGICIMYGADAWRRSASLLVLTLVIGVANGGSFLLDSEGARHSGAQYAYIATSSAGAGALTFLFLQFVPPFVLSRWFPDSMNAVNVADKAAQGTPLVLSIVAGVIATLIWWVGVWATLSGTVADVGPVSALRDTTVLWGLILGAWVLKESIGNYKIAGGLLILAGIVTIVLSR